MTNISSTCSGNSNISHMSNVCKYEFFKTNEYMN